MSKIKDIAIDQIANVLDKLSITADRDNITRMVLSGYNRYPIDNARLLRARIAEDFAKCGCGDKPVAQISTVWLCAECYLREFRNQ